jgi:Na+-driven multidrug efflux pump
VSVPAAIDSMSVACCQLFFLSLVNRLGSEAAAAHGIAIRWEALGYLGGSAFGAAAMAMVSQSLGAKQPHRAARGAWMALIMGGGLMCFMGLVFFTLAWPMCRLYSPHQPAVVELAVMALRLIAFAMPAVAAWTIFTASLRAAGDTRILVFISWFGFLGVRIPLAWLLTQYWEFGLKGAWIAMLADLYVRGTLFVLRFASGKWKRVVV